LPLQAGKATVVMQAFREENSGSRERERRCGPHGSTASRHEPAISRARQGDHHGGTRARNPASPRRRLGRRAGGLPSRSWLRAHRCCPLADGEPSARPEGVPTWSCWSGAWC